MGSDLIERKLEFGNRVGEAAARLQGKRVLVTGAGGSIGRALVRSVRGVAKSLVLLDASEHALYEVNRELRERNDGAASVGLLGSVGDAELLNEVFSRHGPEVVLHAAAFKQVPMLELQPVAAISNNVLGTRTLLRAAVEYGAEEFVLISTDKAVDPCSLMGASKRIAELLTMAAAGAKTRMTAVRLGNVWGTQGSVVELFLQQIAAGGPVTVTHPEARRYMMSLEDAVLAILSGLAPRRGGVLTAARVGEAVRVEEIAQRLIGEEESDAKVTFTELRPGDKLEESMISERERWGEEKEGGQGVLRTVESAVPAASVLQAAVNALEQAVRARDVEGMLRVVQALVPEYRPSATLLEQVSQAALETQALSI